MDTVAHGMTLQADGVLALDLRRVRRSELDHAADAFTASRFDVGGAGTVTALAALAHRLEAAGRGEELAVDGVREELARVLVAAEAHRISHVLGLGACRGDAREPRGHRD